MKNIKGFTLIEILIAIAILGILSTIVLTSLNSARDKAKEARAKQELGSIRSAIRVMAADTGEWPGHQTPNQVNATSSPPNEIADISSASAGLSQDAGYTGWSGPYVNAGLVDPWGNPYFFDTDYDLNGGSGPVNNGVALGSYGPNGVGPNLYDSDDVIVIFPLE